MLKLFHKIRLWILKKLNGRPIENEPVTHYFGTEKPVIPVHGLIIVNKYDIERFDPDELARRVKQDLYMTMEAEMERFMTIRQDTEAGTERVAFYGEFQVVRSEGATHGQG